MPTEIAAVPEGVSFFSESNRRRLLHWVWRPAGDGPFPLLLLLHGVYDAGGFGWWQHARAHDQVAALIADGSIPSVVVVMPSDTGAELGTGYCDWADGTACAETYLVHELIPALERDLPLDGRRFVTGLSMGGYGALLLSLRHPGLFESASSTSGFFDPMRLFGFVPDATDRMWADDTGRAAHDPRLLLDRAVATGQPLPRLAFDCGTDDDLVDQNRDLHQRLRRLGVEHGYAEHPGGHEWSYWRAHLSDHLRFHFGAGGPLEPR